MLIPSPKTSKCPHSLPLVHFYFFPDFLGCPSLSCPRSSSCVPSILETLTFSWSEGWWGLPSKQIEDHTICNDRCARDAGFTSPNLWKPNLSNPMVFASDLSSPYFIADVLPHLDDSLDRCSSFLIVVHMGMIS